MIIICNSSRTRLGIIKHAIAATHVEELNGEFTLDFTAVLNEKIASLVDENSIFELDGNYFDVGSLIKSLNDDGTTTIEVQGDHISYRLNQSQYNTTERYFYSGSPIGCLGEIFLGTIFTVGTCEFSSLVTFIVEETVSRRQLLTDFVAFLGGELYFDGLSISVLGHRGATDVQTVMNDRNIKLLSKTIDKRTLVDGQPKVSYKCRPIYISTDAYALGDDIRVKQDSLGLNTTLRVVRVSRDPYDDKSTTFDFGNYINGLTKSVRDSVKDALQKDKEYNGVAMGPETGLSATGRDFGVVTSLGGDDGLKVETQDHLGVFKPVIFCEEEDNGDTKLRYGGGFTDDVYADELDPNYMRWEGSGRGKASINSTTINIEVTETGDFETDEWTHGFNSSAYELQLLATPLMYDRATIRLTDLRIEETSTTTCRVCGHVEVIT